MLFGEDTVLNHKAIRRFYEKYYSQRRNYRKCAADLGITLEELMACLSA